MYNTSVRLSEKTEYRKNSEGYIEPDDSWSGSIPASRMDVTRNDEILAQSSGYTADVIFRMAAACYNGESVLRDDSDDDEYNIVRHFRGDGKMYVDLTCERREGS